MTILTSSVIEEIYNERKRQVLKEEFDTKHDDGHIGGEMSLAAMCYCMAASVAARVPATEKQYQSSPAAPVWPWNEDWWKPKNPRRDLIRAAALIVAEIERLDRMVNKKGEDNASNS